MTTVVRRERTGSGAIIAWSVVFDRCVEVRVFRWFKRKRLDGAAQRKLTIAMAHAEEELIDTHVENVLEMYETLADDMPIGELLDLYLEEYEPSDQRAGIVARRVLAQLASAPHVRPRPRPQRRS